MVYCRRHGVILIFTVYYHLLCHYIRKYLIYIFQFSLSAATSLSPKNITLARIQLLRSRSEPNVFDKTVPNLRAWLQHLNLLLTLVDTSGRKVDWYTRVFPRFFLFISLSKCVKNLDQYSSLTKNKYDKNVLCFLLGNSPASEFYMPTFRNTLLHLHRQVGVKNELGLRNVGYFKGKGLARK